MSLAERESEIFKFETQERENRKFFKFETQERENRKFSIIKL